MGDRTLPAVEPSRNAAEELQQAHHRPGTSTWPPEWADRVRRGVTNPAQYAKLEFLDVVRLQLETAKMLDGRYGAAAALATANGVIDVVEAGRSFESRRSGPLRRPGDIPHACKPGAALKVRRANRGIPG